MLAAQRRTDGKTSDLAFDELEIERAEAVKEPFAPVAERAHGSLTDGGELAVQDGHSDATSASRTNLSASCTLWAACSLVRVPISKNKCAEKNLRADL